MSDLNAKVIADLKAQLAAAQEEADQQRTRAEAAEQERRAEWERGNSAWEDGYAKGRAQIAAARKALEGVDVEQIGMLTSAATGGDWVAFKSPHDSMDSMVEAVRSQWLRPDGPTECVGVAVADKSACLTGNGPDGKANALAIAALHNAAPALIAAAREVMR